jgi:hypothetical protein
VVWAEDIDHLNHVRKKGHTLRHLLLIAAFLTTQLHAASQNIVTNGGFESACADSARPQYWQIGFTDSPAQVLTNGRWSPDAQIRSEGNQSLKLEPRLGGDYALSQILHVPTYDLKGRLIRLSADVRSAGLSVPPVIMLLAPDLSLPPDPDFGVGLAVKIILIADSAEGVFRSIEGQCTATGNSNYMFVYLYASGTEGAAWFDNVRVELDVDPAGPYPSPAVSPIERRSFDMGFVQENPQDLSEKAMEELLGAVASAGETINLFFHVRWCGLTGEDPAWAHRHQLQQAAYARRAGLKVALSFDFTHDNPESIGDINPKPDESPVGSLATRAVSRAYLDELFFLAEKVRPEIVIVGIEMDIFHDKHPEQWPAYVAMFKAAADTLTRRYPGVHVTAYFTLPWMVDTEGRINSSHAAVWRQLLPQLQSVAYSTYPCVLGLTGIVPVEGYFRKPAEIIPELPVLIPEFGVPGGPDAQLSMDEQAQWLSRMLREFSEVNTRLVCWFSMFDQSYFDIPAYFREAFARLGMHDRNGTAKPAWALWNAVYHAPMTAVPELYPSGEPVPDSPFLVGNYPNPFNPETWIRFDLDKPSRVRVEVVDVTGRKVRILLDGTESAGIHQIRWDASDGSGNRVPAGVYLCRLTSGDRTEVRKMMLLN